jgi:hypothetical protein
MKKIENINKIFLLLIALLAAYQVVTGGHGTNQITIWSYTIGFGTLVVSSIITMIVGFDTFDKPLVIIISALIPLSISNGLVSQISSNLASLYLVFAVIGFLIIILTRFLRNKVIANLTLSLIHAISGLTILILPFYLVINHTFPMNLLFFSVGGIIMGIGGLVIFWDQKEGTILRRNTKYNYLPGLLLLSTILFSLGLSEL